MTTAPSAERSATSAVRIAFGIGGVLSIIVGILILVWPGRTAEIATGIIAVYAIIAGLVYAALGAFSKTSRGWTRVGHVVVGLLFVALGVIALVNLTAVTVGFAVFFGLMIGIVWIVEGIVALTTLGDSASRGWSIVFAIISVIAGIMLLFSPLWGAVLLWWLLGISLVVLGAFQIMRAVTFGKSRR